jgi:hypothetical protein
MRTALEIAMERADKIPTPRKPRPMPEWFAGALRAAQIEDFRNSWAAKGAEYAILQMACEALGIEGLIERVL